MGLFFGKREVFLYFDKEHKRWIIGKDYTKGGGWFGTNVVTTGISIILIIISNGAYSLI